MPRKSLKGVVVAFFACAVSYSVTFFGGLARVGKRDFSFCIEVEERVDQCFSISGVCSERGRGKPRSGRRAGGKREE